MSWFSASKPKITHAQSLAARPVRLVGERLEPTDDGGAKLVVQYQPKFRWIFRVPEGTTKTFELDPMGRLVWESCDGKSSVEQIIRKLARQYNLSFREAEVSTRAFLQMLTRKRLLGMEIDKDALRT